ncbi:peptidoglycan bridge formation glycyltransferase FemA/FemB family protein [Candidatus Saccharibacteria bacterium]|nr:peptidoglycan bridge formation glycyltransferase FemA/FemB family protein [Candidatus Saccharibacteria bacterium]MBR3378285.1 peptidoglycan bridge formation glycyltransferase FemA/FemB family protein [Candidatus Saccharibacteria bacterium]
MSYSVKEIAPAELDKFIAKNHPEVNFLQYSDWGKVHEVEGKPVKYLGLYDDKKLIGSAVMIRQDARRGRYFEIPGGPIMDWDGPIKPIRFFINEIKKIAEAEKCVFVRIRPNIDDTEKHRSTAEKVGLVPSPMLLHAENTVMLDMSKSDDELMADMRRQTRYEVRRSAKLGIKVSYDTSEKAFDEFYDLQLETAERQGFIQSPRKIVQAQREVYGDKARIYTAELDGKKLCQGLIIFAAPEAIYHEAASTLDGRKYPGAYALQWQVIQDAKKLGMKRYNLFGIAPPNSPNHRFAGVTTFKTGFGGEQITYMPAQDIVVNKFRYKLVSALEKARKKKRHL